MDEYDLSGFVIRPCEDAGEYDIIAPNSELFHLPSSSVIPGDKAFNLGEKLYEWVGKIIETKSNELEY